MEGFLSGVCDAYICVLGVASTSAFNLVKSVTGLFPRSTPRIGQRPPFDLWSR